MTLIEWINKTNDETDVTVMDDYDDSCCCSVCGTMRLTEDGKKHFERILDKEVDEVDECYITVCGIENDTEVMLLSEMIEGFAGYISKARWKLLFSDKDEEQKTSSYKIVRIEQVVSPKETNKLDVKSADCYACINSDTTKIVGAYDSYADAEEEYKRLRSRLSAFLTTNKNFKCIGYAFLSVENNVESYLMGCSEVVVFDNKKFNDKPYYVEVKAMSDVEWEIVDENAKPLEELCECINYGDGETSFLCDGSVEFRILDSNYNPMYLIYYDVCAMRCVEYKSLEKVI